MKKLLGIVVLGLFLITPSQADDIRDFQIEGISIGSSLLEYYEEEEIKKEVKKSFERKHQYKNNFIDVNFRPKGDEGYENIMITIKSNDNNYTIYVVAGITYFKNDIKNCYSKTNEISKEIKNMFSKKIKSKKINRKHWADKTGKSKNKGIEFKFKGGDIDLRCYDWSKNMNKKYNYSDSLMISIKSKEFQNTAF